MFTYNAYSDSINEDVFLIKVKGEKFTLGNVKVLGFMVMGPYNN
jgi:predicted RNA-binding protein